MAIGPIIRVVAQAALPLVRAFAVAYQQALVNARKGGSEAAKDMIKKKGGMTQSEAFQILDLAEDAGAVKVESAYKRLFDANEPDAGGSFYLQSKVHRAREFLITELNQPPPKP